MTVEKAQSEHKVITIFSQSWNHSIHGIIYFEFTNQQIII